jgi:AcrR family transcriptional regulator
MDVLAKEATVARATVYEHFRSKRAVLDELASTTARMVALDTDPTTNGDPLRALRDVLSDVCRHWAAHEDTMRELRTLSAMTGGEHPTDGVDPDALRRLVDALSSCGQLRGHWSPEDATDALVVLTSYPTYERLRQDKRSPEQVESVLAKLAVSIVAPGGSA